MSKCDHCPCPGKCFSAQIPIFCKWASSGDPIKLAHIVYRSEVGQNGLNAPTESHATIFDKARNFTAAAIQHVAVGMPEASPELQAERLAICEACELMTPERTCRHKSCGCQLDRKSAWLDQHCPIGKW